MRQNIVIWPDNALVRLNQRVEFQDTKEFKEWLHQLLMDMRDTLWHVGGAGLAAPQIGVNYQICLVMKGMGTPKPQMIEMINPRIIANTKEKVTSVDEGCLSFPGERLDVERHKHVVVEYWDRDGKHDGIDSFQQNDDFLSLVIQHEIEHLHGLTLADHMGSMRRDMVRRRMMKLKEGLQSDQPQATMQNGNVPVRPGFRAR